MPKDSRSIVIDYNVLKQNEDMGVGSTVDFYFGEGQPPVSVTVSGLFDSNKDAFRAWQNWPSDGVTLFRTRSIVPRTAPGNHLF